MSKLILVLGATGIFGQPVTNSLLKTGNQVRILARNYEKAHQIFGDKVEIIKGSALNKGDIQKAMSGCDAVHISLSQVSELAAMQHVTVVGKTNGLERVTYISATTASEANRWYDLIDVKIRTEDVLRSSGISNTIFCPTWAMETLRNFIRGDRAVLIVSRNPPPLHFIAAVDLGQMVAASYQDNRALGKRLFVHGPESITLPDAFRRFTRVCHPEKKITQLKLWQAQLIAKLTGRRELTDATRLIAYFDKVGELGDPSEANALLGAPSITLDEWSRMQKTTINS